MTLLKLKKVKNNIGMLTQYKKRKGSFTALVLRRRSQFEKKNAGREMSGVQGQLLNGFLHLE